MASEAIVSDVSDVLFLGELSLDGGLRHPLEVPQMVGLARDRGIRTVYVPAVDAAEAALIDAVEVLPVPYRNGVEHGASRATEVPRALHAVRLKAGAASPCV